MITFQKVVTTSGTPVQLPDNAVQDNETLIVKAKNANTGVIYVGNTGPNALKTSNIGFSLQKNEAVSIKVDNAIRIFIDSSVSGEGVECIIA